MSRVIGNISINIHNIYIIFGEQKNIFVPAIVSYRHGIVIVKIKHKCRGYAVVLFCYFSLYQMSFFNKSFRPRVIIIICHNVIIYINR